MPAPRPERVSLFVTCLVDLFFPQVGEATVQVLRHLGLPVDFPQGQTCCGQPAFNSGFWAEARVAARRFLDAFAGSECIVAPSGSCVAMVRHHYGELLAGEPALLERAREVARHTYELSEFLVRVLGVEDLGARLPARVTYHDSCHALRELGLAREPRALLRNIRGLELVEHQGHNWCCGFGGTFAVKYAPISTAILQDKVDAVTKSGAEIVTSTDVSCLMNIAGALSRQGAPVQAVHLAELLARGLGGTGGGL